MLATLQLSFAIAATTLATVRHLSPPLPCSPGQQPVRQRLGQASMGLEDGGSLWNPADASVRSAAYRAQQRAMRKSSHNPFEPRMSAAQSPMTSEPLAAEGQALVLLFNAGRPDEGVYTQTHSERGTSVLAFECVDDANRFGQLLLTKGFGLPTAQPWTEGRLAGFCQTAGIEVTMVPRGTEPEPPAGGPQRMQPPPAQFGQGWGRAARRDSTDSAYSAYRRWLDDLFVLTPDNCGDDDCILG